MLVPKGKLFPIGGAERRRADKTEESLQEKMQVLLRVLKEMKGTSSRFEIIPTASAIPIEVSEEYVEVFDELGCSNVGIMNIRTKAQANDKEFLRRIEEADGVMFTGGDQSKIVKAFAGTKFSDILQQKYMELPDFVISGTSAGAMMMSEVMIFGGQSLDAITTGKANLKPGMGFMPSAIIDSHFVNRGRFGRLAVAVVHHPHLTGIGLSEDTGVIITEGYHLEVVGSGHVVIFEANELGYNNAKQKRTPSLAFENMRFHFLHRGLKYDMREDKFVV